jgi:microcystin degradation protein MlrC
MTFRVAVGGFMHETNTFAPTKAAYEAFVHGAGWPALCAGPALVEATRNVNMGISGFVEEAQAAGWTLLPTVWCHASPSAHVTKDAFERITGDIVERLRAPGPVDGVYLDLHGAMVTEHLDDGEAEILARVRRVIGPGVPLVASLDLHANVSSRMVDAADVLVAYRTYPHVDMALTGRRAARLLGPMLLSSVRPAKAFRQVPFLIPISWQCTDIEPGRSLYARLAAMEGGPVTSMSFAPGFPAADIPDCAPSVMAYAATQEDADVAAESLYAAILADEPAFAGRIWGPDEGVREAMRIAAGAKRPVVIADTQDNPGAGGDSNTTGMLRALVANGAKRAAIGVIVDPDAAALAHAAGPGATIRFALGGQSRIPGGAPFEAEFAVERLASGPFVAPGPYYGGSRMDLGLCACLRIEGVRIVVGSLKAQLADLAMYRHVGIEPTEQAILVNKSSVHFRADFAPMAEEILICAAPGPMPADPADLPWRRLRPGTRLRPLGPAFVPS